MISGSASEGSKTIQGQAVGTPSFMAPEQASGSWDVVGYRSDVYALGAILYAIQTGHAPLSGGSISEILERVVQGEFPRPRERKRDVDKPLEAICLKAMALKPDDRYESAAAMANDLEQWLADEPVVAYREPWSVRCRRWMRRHRTLVSSAAVLLLTALVGLSVGLVLVNRERDQKETAFRNERAAKETAQRETDLKKRALADVTRAKKRIELEKDLKEKALHSATQSKEEADLARRKAEKNEKDAVLARREAETKEKEAKEKHLLALQTLVHQVHSVQMRLTNVAGAGELRRDLLLRSLEDLARVSDRLETQDDADRTTILAHQELGDVHLMLGGNSGGAVDKSGRRPAKSDQQTSATLKALKHFQAAHAIARKLSAANPDDRRARQDVSVLLGRLGDVRLQLGDVKEALKHYLAGLEIDQAFANANPENDQIKRDFSISLRKLGDVQLLLGDVKEARKYYRISLILRRSRAAAKPDDEQAQRELSIALNQLGAVQLQLGLADEALKYYQESYKIDQKLADSKPNDAQALRDLSTSLEGLGDAQLRRGDAKRALKHYQDSYVIRNRQAVADPNNNEVQRNLLISLNKLGDAHLSLGDAKQALEHFQECFAIAQKLAANDRENVRAQSDLSLSLGRLGDVRKRMGDAKGALKHYLNSLKIDRALAAADPDNANAQRNLSVTLESLGDVELGLGDLNQALKHYSESRVIREKLTANDPNDTRLLEDLFISLNRLGNLQLKLGEAKKAQVHFQDSLKVLRKLIAANPEDARAQRNLSVSLNRLGDARRQLGDFREAQQFYQDSLKLGQKLAADDPDSLLLQTDVVVRHYNLGLTLKGLFEFGKAQAQFESAKTILTRLEKAGRLKGQAQYLQWGKIMEREAAYCRMAEKAVADLEFAMKLPPEDAVVYLPVRAAVLAKLGRHADAVETAEKLATLKPVTSENLYNAARACSLSVRGVQHDKKPEQLTKQEKALREKYATRALELLQQAVDMGLKDTQRVEQEKDFDPIRERMDFRNLIKSLDGKSSSSPIKRK